MPLLKEVGTLTSPASTGTQNVSLSSFGGESPQAVIIWGTGQTVSGNIAHATLTFGMATSTTARAAVAMNQESAGINSDEDRHHDDTAVILLPNESGTVIERADLSSFSADQFALSWEVVTASARRYHYLALGGTDFQANLIALQAPVSTGTQNYAHGLTATPEALISMSAANLTAAPSQDFAAEAGIGIGFSDLTTDKWSGIFISSGAGSRSQSSTFLSHAQPAENHEDSVVSAVDATNVTLNWTKANSAEYHYFLAMEGVTAEVGTFTSPATATTQTISTSITPVAMLALGFMGTASAFVEDDARFTIGATDGTNDRTAGVLSVSSASHRFTANNLLRVYNHSQGILESAGLQMISGSDITLDFTTADTPANEFIYFALGSDETPPAPPGGTQRVQIVAWKDTGEDSRSSVDPPVIYFSC